MIAQQTQATVTMTATEDVSYLTNNTTENGAMVATDDQHRTQAAATTAPLPQHRPHPPQVPATARSQVRVSLASRQD